VGVIEIQRSTLGNLDLLARGNQAKLYRAPGATVPGIAGPLVYKEYLPGVRRERLGIRNSLSGLIRLRDDVSAQHRAIIDRRSAWPRAIVLEGTETLGLLMTELAPHYFTDITYGTGRRDHLPRDSALYLQTDDQLQKVGLPPLTEEGRMWLMARTLSFMNLLHGLGIIVGDFSSNNVVFGIDHADQSRNQPIFVDVDSFRMATGVPALTQSHTPDWESPEHLRHRAEYHALVRANAGANEQARAGAAMRVQDRRSDVYKTALFVMRNFHSGENPHSVNYSEQAIARLAALRPGFVPFLERALSEDPRKRPTMNELTKAFVGDVARKP
jgi:hypothetical protein